MRPTRPTRNHSRERGTIAVIAAVSMLGLLGFTGMAIDVGYLQWSRVRIQDAADAAAQAAIIEGAASGTAAEIESAGTSSAALNGYTNGSNGVTVTINTPPKSGSLSGETNAAEAIVTQTVPTFFMGMFNLSSVTVNGRAAGSWPSSSGSGSGSGSAMGCVYVLDTSSSDSEVLNIQGTSPTFNCGVVVESPNASAVYLSGAETVTIGTGYTLGVVGPSTCAAAQPATQTNCGIDYTSNQDYICSTGSSSCAASAEPTANGISSPGDPLANVTAPSPKGVSIIATNPYYNMNALPANNEIQPGVYCSGLEVGNTNGATYTFEPGTYFIAGGTLEIQATGTVTGTGVTFYLTSPSLLTAEGGPSCGTSTTMATVNITGQANVNWTAPASGATSGVPGMLFFEDRSSPTDNAPSINGNSSTVFTGALYFKNSTLTYTGVNTGSSDYTMIVVKKLDINGNSPIVVYNKNNPLTTSTSTSSTGAAIAE